MENEPAFQETRLDAYPDCMAKDTITPGRTDERKIRDLYPELTEEQLKEAEENLHRYLEIAWRIYQRLKQERPEIFDKRTRPTYDVRNRSASTN